MVQEARGLSLAQTGGNHAAQAARPSRSHKVDVIGGSVTADFPFSDGCTMVRLCSNADVHFRVEAANILGPPTCTEEDPRLPAGAVEYVQVRVGDYIAFELAAGVEDADVTVTEMGTEHAPFEI